MTTRIRRASAAPTAARKSVTFTAVDLADIAKLRGSIVGRAVLSDLSAVQVTSASSEAQVLHAVMEAGLRVVRERVQESSYAEEAAAASHAAEDAERRAAARRRPPRWADEE